VVGVRRARLLLAAHRELDDPVGVEQVVVTFPEGITPHG
jgi:hypothetical protein